MKRCLNSPLLAAGMKGIFFFAKPSYESRFFFCKTFLPPNSVQVEKVEHF